MARYVKQGETTPDRKIAIALGLGLSQERAAELAGVAPNTVAKHLKENSEYIQKVKAETEAIASVKFNAKLKQAEAAANRRTDIQAMKQEIREEIYGKLLDTLRKEGLSDELFTKLSKIGLEFTDEKPAQVQRRISEHTEKVEYSISGETWDRVEQYFGQIGVLPQPALDAPKVIDVVVLSDGPE